MVQDRYRYMQFAIRTSDVDLKDWEELRDKMIAIEPLGLVQMEVSSAMWKASLSNP